LEYLLDKINPGTFHQNQQIHKIERNHTLGMESSEREDYLEAVLVRYLAAQAPPSAKDVSDDLSQVEDAVLVNLKSLEKQGDLVFDENGKICLTAKGHSIAERVLKKHRVLQCFLGEILGMDDNAASDEACILEHSISDSAIHRIGDYVKTAESRRGRDPGNIPCEGPVNNTTPDSKGSDLMPGLSGASPSGSPSGPVCCSLTEAQVSIPLTVTGITGGEHLHRLIDLGVIPGEIVILKRRLHNNAVVLQVKECDIALSPEIAGTILVEKIK
jgi:DtxR family Mn-dependent transcriptional regulator